MTASHLQLQARLTSSELCETDEGWWEVAFHALGSDCELFFAADTVEQAQRFAGSALAWIATFEARHSRFLPDSELSLINLNAAKGFTSICAETELLLDLCDQVHFATQGAFDPTSLPLSELWSWRQRSAAPAVPTAEEIAAAKAHIGWKRVQRAQGKVLLPEPGMKLDFGGVGKEFAVDSLLRVALGCGIQHVMVDLGGDIAVHGEPPEGGGWYVGLEDPLDNNKCYCGIRLRSGAAVASSGDYRRCFQHQGTTYGHIIDCRSGWPVAHGTRAVSVIAPRCTQAGLLSTAAMILGGQAAIDLLDRTPGVQGCVWHLGRILETRGFRRSVLPKGWEDA
jgi:FAD:protein FMN transferase